MYSLSYEMMAQILQQFGYSGEVHADVSADSALKRSGHIVLVTRDGNIIACTIFSPHGQKLYHNGQAHLMLSRLGVLDWRLVNAPAHENDLLNPPPLTTKPPNRTISVYPRRLPVSQSQIRSWSVFHRSVYSLADGNHSIEQIATLLSHTPQRVEQAVFDLQGIGGIARPE